MEKGEKILVLITNLFFSVLNNNIFYHIYLFSCILIIKPCVGPSILWMLGQSLLRGYFVYNIFHLVILYYLFCFYFLVYFLKSSHSSGHPCCNFQHVLCGFMGCFTVIFINWKNCMLFSIQFLWITSHYVYYSHCHFHYSHCFAIHMSILLTIYIIFLASWSPHHPTYHLHHFACCSYCSIIFLIIYSTITIAIFVSPITSPPFNTPCEGR